LFIKNFEPELIRDDKQYEIAIENNGTYRARYRIDDKAPANLSESDRTLFRYLCFLKNAEFWQGFERLRNMHGVGKPLIVKNFIERLDESVNADALLARGAKLNRQFIILTTPNTK
jgi:hypothetical protein